MTDREQNVLALLYEERIDELTPAYLAYRLRIASSQAAELLDSLVRSGTLDLYFDAEGNISYGLPASEKERLSRQPVQIAQPEARPHASQYDDPALEAYFFGSGDTGQPVNHQPQPSPAPYQAAPYQAADYYPPADPNGYDGNIDNYRGGNFGYVQPPAAYQQPPAAYQQPQPLPHPPQYRTSQYAPHPEQPYPRMGPAYAPTHGQMVRYDRPADQLIEVPRESNPSVAAFLSFLVVGGGQWYNGEYAKGAWMFIGCAISWLFLMGWIVSFWSIIDAYAVAKERRSLPR